MEETELVVIDLNPKKSDAFSLIEVKPSKNALDQIKNLLLLNIKIHTSLQD